MNGEPGLQLPSPGVLVAVAPLEVVSVENPSAGSPVLWVCGDANPGETGPVRRIRKGLSLKTSERCSRAIYFYRVYLIIKSICINCGYRALKSVTKLNHYDNRSNKHQNNPRGHIAGLFLRMQPRKNLIYFKPRW